MSTDLSRFRGLSGSARLHILSNAVEQQGMAHIFKHFGAHTPTFEKAFMIVLGFSVGSFIGLMVG